MTHYEHEYNVISDRTVVEDVLALARQCMNKGHEGITILDRRPESLEFRREAKIKAKTLIECIARLGIEAYSNTSVKQNEVDAHVFGVELNERKAYMKFQIIEDTLVVKVLSLHEPSWEMTFPYRR